MQVYTLDKKCRVAWQLEPAVILYDQYGTHFRLTYLVTQLFHARFDWVAGDRFQSY